MPGNQSALISLSVQLALQCKAGSISTHSLQAFATGFFCARWLDTVR